jgi:transposase InsO family protein
LLDLAKQPLPGTPPPLRTLERWLARTDLPPAPPGRRPAERPPRAQEPHERWQMDAMDQVRLGDGRQASCLRIVDECSGALWATAFSPQGNWAQVPAAQTQAMLRQWLACWGRPLQIRVDNGTPWGSSDDVPTPLALWLVGLGVARHWNDPSCPQQNGVVERSMGTFKGWSEPRTCQSVEQ